MGGAELGDELFGVGTVRHVGWEIVDDVAFAGERSYFSTYGPDACLGLISPPLTLTSGQSSQFSFVTRYAIESGFDAGLVQISTDGGDSWQVITPNGGYPASMNQSNDGCGFADGQLAFTGTALDWTPYTFDLSAYSGQIQLRFLFSTDEQGDAEGWWIDEIAVSHVQVPGSCLNELLFGDGFED